MDAAVTKNPAKSPIQIDIKIAPTVKLFATLNDQSIITRNIANTTNPILIANEFLFSPMLYNWCNIIINVFMDSCAFDFSPGEFFPDYLANKF